jgi:hypothetical protein
MKSKYYTPEIEEFCIGFEYEVVYEDNSVYKYIFGEDLENSDGFIPWITPDYFLKLLSENKIRAKHLDQEDIESLGFSLFKEDVNLLRETVVGFISEKYNLILGYYPDSKKVSLITKDPSKNKIYSKTGQDPYKIAGIKIKNKTELTKLLKQLEII